MRPRSGTAARPGKLSGCANHDHGDCASSIDSPPNAPVDVQFRNVDLHIADSVILEIRHINGALMRTNPAKPPAFDDQRSFTLRIDSGEMAMSSASLTHLMNDHVFAYPGAPLKKLEISIEDGRLQQRGRLHKGIVMPFSIEADVSATPDGRIRLHPTSVKALGIPAAGLMKLFGLELDEVIKLKRSPGVEILDNDFLLDPGRLLPAPAIQGHLTFVKIEGDRVVQIFGPSSPHEKLQPPEPVRNYMYYRGGTLQFGKLTMSDADMQLIDADPRDPFDLFPAQYLKQLVAGYSKTTPSSGLKVYMPDYNEAAGQNLKPRPVS